MKPIVVALLLLHTSASSSSTSSSSPGAAGMLKPLFQYIDDHQNQFVQRLTEWVAVQSNSGDHTVTQEKLKGS
ncbi:hypothetical protein J4Q44_G00394610 [Coregonus suidteri]|uniref:Uncharacterized protein n=1 Tax=Coregonus suidteri TaxID=861788 RepID=A0AAN8KI80_9TELE